MQIFNDTKLALRFRSDSVSEREKFFYFLIYTALISILTSTWASSNLLETINKWDIYADILIILSNILGTILIYHTNSKGDNRDFISRSLCLSFPVAVKALLLIILFYLLALLSDVFAGTALIEDGTSAFEFSMMALLMLFFYFRLNRAIRLASTLDH